MNRVFDGYLKVEEFFNIEQTEQLDDIIFSINEIVDDFDRNLDDIYRCLKVEFNERNN